MKDWVGLSGCCLLLFLVFICNSVEIIVSNKTNDLKCNGNSLCIIQCREYRSCALSSIFCLNSSECHIICNASESCLFSTIYRTEKNNKIHIDCINTKSCQSLSLVTSAAIKLNLVNNNKSLELNAYGIYSAMHVTLHNIGILYNNIDINCYNQYSCYSMLIYLNNDNITTNNINNSNATLIDNHMFSFNMLCKAIQSCEEVKIEVANDWNNNNNLYWSSFNLSILCLAQRSCYHTFINTASLLIDNINSIYGNLYVYCQNKEESCLMMDIICPDLIPFHSIYDYLYHESKCHISVINSTSNKIDIYSKHGYQMIDLLCHSNCDGIIIYCADFSIFCKMMLDTDKNISGWYCDHLNQFYTYPDTNYQYGCDYYVELDNIAIIHTSQLPNYNDTIAQINNTIDCLYFNPSMTDSCYIYCDRDYSCYKYTKLVCNNVDKCYIACTGLETCQDYLYIYCPNNTNHNSLCHATIHPTILKNTINELYNNIYGYIYFYSYIHAPTDPNPPISYFSFNGIVITEMLPFLRLRIFDYGIKTMNITIEDMNITNNYNITKWTDYSTWSWYQIAGGWINNDNQPLNINMKCTFCYNKWIWFSGYENKDVSLNFVCDRCQHSVIESASINNIIFDCIGNCDNSKIKFLDSNVTINGHHTYDNMNIYLLISNISNINQYNIYLNLYGYNNDITIYTFYGFNNLNVNQTNNNNNTIHGYCGYPDYYIDYNFYPFIADNNTNTCYNSNPEYSSIELALHVYEWQDKNITSESIECNEFLSCYKTNFFCIGNNCIIRCTGIYGCYVGNIYISNQNSLTLYCEYFKSCTGLNIYIIDVHEVNIHCYGMESCNQLNIEYKRYNLVPNIGLNLICYDISNRYDIGNSDINWMIVGSCKSLNIICPNYPNANDLVQINITGMTQDIINEYTKCHFIFDAYNKQPTDININSINGLKFIDIKCHFNDYIKDTTCSNVYVKCDESYNKLSYFNYSYNLNNTVCVGDCCSYVNTISPTVSPSQSPTTPPTNAPSIAPTFSPTLSPTRYPTIWLFNSYFDAKFYLSFRTININVSEFLDDNNIIYVTHDIQEAIENGYLLTSSSNLFSEFMVNITELSYDIDNINNNNSDLIINISSIIHTDIDSVTHYVKYSTTKTFEETVEEYVINAWKLTEKNNLLFGVYPDSIYYDIMTNTNVSNIDYAIITSLTFTSFIWLIAILSLMHNKNKLIFLNKIPGIRPCDDQSYAGVVSYGVQVFDLYSDVLFCSELINYEAKLSNLNDIQILKVLYSFSLIFVIIPYINNIVISLTFNTDILNKLQCSVCERNNTADTDNDDNNNSSTKKRKSHQLSLFTANYFRSYPKLFSFFVITSGGVLPSLKLCDSRIFGLKYFHAGFNKVEFERFAKYRIYNTIVLENCPQIIIQLIYVTYFGNDIITFTFLSSVIASIISVLSSIMAYIVQKNNSVKHETYFEIDIILINNQIEINDNKLFKKEIKKLQKKNQNKRKLLSDITSKALNRLSTNFEICYSLEQLHGVTFYGLCTSDDEDGLSKLFEKKNDELLEVIGSVLELPSMNVTWKASFRVVSFHQSTYSISRNVELGHILSTNETNQEQGSDVQTNNQPNQEQ